MILNLVGKFSNLWGCEHMIQRGFEALGHIVHPFEISHSYAILRRIEAGGLTVVLQGYGLAPKLIESIRRLTKKPVVLWHAEILPESWTTDDSVAIGKAEELRKNVLAFDGVGHNCRLPLGFIRQIGGKNVFHALDNGVDATVHRIIPGIQKIHEIGMYGHQSPRRVEIVKHLCDMGLAIKWLLPGPNSYGEDLIRFINSCKLILNFHYSQSRNFECRIYESIGCGVPVVSEPVSMPDLIPEEYGLLQRDTPESIVEACRNLLSDTKVLESIGQLGYNYFHENHSYTNRCQFFISEVEKLIHEGRLM